MHVSATSLEKPLLPLWDLNYWSPYAPTQPHCSHNLNIGLYYIHYILKSARNSEHGLLAQNACDGTHKLRIWSTRLLLVQLGQESHSTFYTD
jgi:hypothetical protein